MENNLASPYPQTWLHRYQSLDTTEEIRLIKILPGQLEDNLPSKIHHTVLHVYYKSPAQRLRINQLRETVPEDGKSSRR